jgi:D-alanyl-D-alanine carboxypeptidase
MTPSVWRRGCPVGLSSLRHVSLPFVGFDGRPRRGALVVHNGVARDVLTVFRRLYAARFPIRRMRPIQAYGGDDFASIEADNTSAFNCRAATGSSRWSEHAYGRAIDLNPLENPYVSGGRTSHRRSVPYLDRSRVRRGMVVEGGVVVRAFDAVGWGWGGRWSGIKDYQHFSSSGG